MQTFQLVGRLHGSLLAWALCGVMLLTPIAAEENEDYLGPSSLVASRDGGTLYIACAEARKVVWIELSTGKKTRQLEVPAEPTGLALSSDGRSLIVTCAAPTSTVLVIDPDTGKVRAKLTTGHTSMSPVITPDGKRLYVCNRYNDDISVIDLSTSTEMTRIRVDREPVAAAITPDGNALLVANHLPNTRADQFFVDPIAAVVTVIDTRTHDTTALRLPVGSNGLRGLCVSPDGKHAFVTHIVSNFELIPMQLDLGWTNINAVSIIDIINQKVINTVGLDELYMGAGNPWGIACTADGSSVYITSAGTHELTVVRTSLLLDDLSQMFVSPYVSTLPEEPDVKADQRRRIKLPGKGPRSLTIVGSKVYVAEYFSDTLTEVDIDVENKAATTMITLGPEPKLTARRRGQILFNDATICYQQWQSCASCHPDGRTDALNWDLMNDGVGNTKNTKSMILSFKTPPMMAEGVRATAKEAVRAGLEHILFAYRSEEEARDLDAYIKTLRPVPSPRLVDGKLSPSAERGKELFESVRGGCKRCHPSPLFTDLKMHNVGTRSSFGFNDLFDTPTLIEVWRSAPYLHDGRYSKMKDLFTEGKHGLGGGRFEKLSAQEIDDLVEYVLSL